MIKAIARMFRKAVVDVIGRAGLINACELYLHRQQAKLCQARSISSGVMFSASAAVRNWNDDPELITIGPDSVVNGELLVFPSGGRISLGRGCFLGENSRIWSMERVTIGDHVLISHNVSIMDTDSHEVDYRERAVSGVTMLTVGLLSNCDNIAKAAITIGSHTWIGIGSTILKGVSIGEGAIVAAGSVVTRDVPPFTLVAGNPAREIRSVRPAGDTGTSDR